MNDQLQLFPVNEAPQPVLRVAEVICRFCFSFPLDDYRCIALPRSNTDYGRWEFKYKGNWHEVINYQIRKELNKMFGFYPENKYK